MAHAEVKDNRVGVDVLLALCEFQGLNSVLEPSAFAC